MTREDYEALVIAREYRNWSMPLTYEDIFNGDFTDTIGYRAAYLELKDAQDLYAGYAQDIHAAVLWHDRIGVRLFKEENYNKTWRLWHICPDTSMRKYLWWE